MTRTSVFTTVFIKDDVDIDITVLDDSDPPVAVNISGATLITWKIANDELSGALLTKSFPASGITLPANGTDGVFRVGLVTADTSALSTRRYYQEGITTLTGSVSHVVVGTLWLRPTII